MDEENKIEESANTAPLPDEIKKVKFKPRTKNAWKKRIKQACIEAGTYREYFDDTIDTLAATLEIRDQVLYEYLDHGAIPIVTYKNKAGAVNLAKSPYLMLYDEYNTTALAYWRDLGLTPKGLKAIDESALKNKEMDPFAAALSGIGI